MGLTGDSWTQPSLIWWRWEEWSNKGAEIRDISPALLSGEAVCAPTWFRSHVFGGENVRIRSAIYRVHTKWSDAHDDGRGVATATQIQKAKMLKEAEEHCKIKPCLTRTKLTRPGCGCRVVLALRPRPWLIFGYIVTTRCFL